MRLSFTATRLLVFWVHLRWHYRVSLPREVAKSLLHELLVFIILGV